MITFIEININLAKKMLRIKFPELVVDEMLGCIYLLTCTVNNKKYVGQSKLVKYKNDETYNYGAKGRWSDHISDSSNESRQPIHIAIREYGSNSFSINIIKVAPIFSLDQLESHYINELNTLVPNGYNVQGVGFSKTTNNRLKLLLEKYGTYDPRLNDNELEQKRVKLESILNDNHYTLLKSLEGIQVERVRIATSKGKTAKRQNGQDYEYMKVMVYAYPLGLKYAKDNIKFAFGGLHIPINDSYRNAVEFARKIPLINGGKFDDQVKL